MENRNNDGFSFTYSAREQAELREIRSRYASPKEDKMDRLRRLDRAVTQKAQTVALVLGVIGALILGFGMSLVMSELPDVMGLARSTAMVIGVAVGIVGGILTGLAYPMYQWIITRERKRIAPEILRLTDELMK